MYMVVVYVQDCRSFVEVLSISIISVWLMLVPHRVSEVSVHVFLPSLHGLMCAFPITPVLLVGPNKHCVYTPPCSHADRYTYEPE